MRISRINLAFVLLVFTLSCTSKKEITDDKEHDFAQSELIKVYNFPDDWIGSYSGSLKIFNADGLQMEIPMKLEISEKKPEGYWPWTLHYNDTDVREYGLFVNDSISGHYVIDEFNGILIDAFIMENTLVSHFSVNGSEITSIYKKQDEGMEFEIIASTNDTLTTSQAEDAGMIFSVGSFPVTAFQKAELLREQKK